MNRFAALSVAALIATPAAALDLSAAQVTEMTAAVAKRLKDPKSARISDFRAGSTKNGVMVCGYVNGKNSFGAYAGDQPFHGIFLGASGKFLVVSIASTRIERLATREVCSNNGIQF